jgi:hypothetical protein
MTTKLAHQRNAAANTLKNMGYRRSLLRYAPKQTSGVVEILD